MIPEPLKLSVVAVQASVAARRADDDQNQLASGVGAMTTVALRLQGTGAQFTSPAGFEGIPASTTSSIARCSACNMLLIASVARQHDATPFVPVPLPFNHEQSDACTQIAVLSIAEVYASYKFLLYSMSTALHLVPVNITRGRAHEYVATQLIKLQAYTGTTIAATNAAVAGKTISACKPIGGILCCEHLIV